MRKERNSERNTEEKKNRRSRKESGGRVSQHNENLKLRGGFNLGQRSRRLLTGFGLGWLQRDDALSPQVENLLQSHDNCGSLRSESLVRIRTLKRGRVYLEKRLRFWYILFQESGYWNELFTVIYRKWKYIEIRVDHRYI